MEISHDVPGEIMGAEFTKPPSSRRIPAQLHLHVWQSLFFLLIVVSFVPAAIRPEADPDFWWHVTTGNWILSHHALPQHDLYTFTVAQRAWVPHEWLSEVVLAALFNLGGLALVSLGLGSIAMIGFLLVWRAIDQHVDREIACLALGLGVASANPIWGPRTQVFTFTLWALTYLWTERFCRGQSNWIYALPLIIVVWVNLHGGFVIAYVLLILIILTESGRRLVGDRDPVPAWKIRHLVVVLAASLVASLANPALWRSLAYPITTQTSELQQSVIVEWSSPNFHLPQLRFFELTVLLLLLLLVGRRSTTWRQLAIMLIGLGLALQSVRHLPLFMVVSVPVLAAAAQARWAELTERNLTQLILPSVRTAIVASALTLPLVAGYVFQALSPSLTQRLDGPRLSRLFPVEVVNVLQKHPPPGHMLNAYGWGGYLIYRLFPSSRVFIYGDGAVTDGPLLADYTRIASVTPDAPELLNGYDINWVIFRTEDPIITALRRAATDDGRPAWFELINADDATILMRDNDLNRRYVQMLLEAGN